jgi:putative endonuclease
MDAAEALNARQRARIQRATEAFLMTRPDLNAFDIRFDVMLARPWRYPMHLMDAWRS